MDFWSQILEIVGFFCCFFWISGLNFLSDFFCFFYDTFIELYSLKMMSEEEKLFLIGLIQARYHLIKHRTIQDQECKKAYIEVFEECQKAGHQWTNGRTYKYLSGHLWSTIKINAFERLNTYGREEYGLADSKIFEFVDHDDVNRSKFSLIFKFNFK